MNKNGNKSLKYYKIKKETNKQTNKIENNKNE